MVKRVYVVCSFDPADPRTYTYHQDLDEGVTPLEPGQVGHVMHAKTNRMKRVDILSITDTVPKFPTKPVVLYVAPSQEPPANQTAFGSFSDEDISGDGQ